MPEAIITTVAAKCWFSLLPAAFTYWLSAAGTGSFCSIYLSCLLSLYVLPLWTCGWNTFLTPDLEVTVMHYFPRKNCTYSQTPAKVHILLRLCRILNVHLWAKSWSSRGNLRNCSKMQWDACTCWNYLQRKQLLGPIKMSRTGAFLTHQIAS